MEQQLQKGFRQSIFVIAVLDIVMLAGFIVLYFTGRSEDYALSPVIRDLLALLEVASAVALFLLFYRTGCKMVKEARRQAETWEKIDKSMRETVGNIAHDLKAPVTAIKGYSQGILDKVADTPDKIYKYISTIHGKADDMSRIIDELSLFTKGYKDKIQYDFQKVNMNQYMSDCIDALCLDLETRHVELVYQYFAKKDIYVNLDRDKFKRIIYNVIDNALKYNDAEHGVLHVCIESKDEEMLVHIADNGNGIPKEELPMIFERFYRTDSSRHSSTGGSGLGLTIAKQIIEGHNGRIWAESEIGKGTKISFTLPIVQ